MKVYNILIVDDSPEHIDILTAILKKDNPIYHISAASNGKIAIDIIKAAHPHLIIMDWDMPEMNGIETTIALKSDIATKDIPVIMVSGMHINQEAFLEAMKVGIVDFIKKPFDKIEIVARVHSKLKFVESFQELIEQKELNYRQEISYKTKELAEHAFTLAKQNEFLFYIIEQLKKLQDISNAQGKKIIYELIENTNRQLSENAWENLEQQFNQVYPEFYNHLGKRFPNLTINERKLCSLLRMNLSSKEIASITFQEPASVDVARYRLRQKLRIDKVTNLSVFLMNL